MIYATITQQGTELILEKTNLVYRYSSNLEFKFIKDENFKDYELRGYIQRDEKDYLLEIKEDDTFEVLPEFMDRNKFVRLSFALKNESKVIHLGVVKIYVNDAFGNETTVPPEKQELLVEVVQKEVEKNLEEPLKKVEKVEKDIEQFDSDYGKFNEKLQSANKIYDDVADLKKEIDEDKNDIDKKISSFNEKENQLNTAIDNFNNDFVEKKNQIENDKVEINKKVNDFNENVIISKKSIDDQATSAVELVNKTKEQSLNELSKTKETIDNDISSKQKDIDDLVENSKKEINDLADSSLKNIENEKKSSVEAIDVSKTNALNDISNASSTAVEDIQKEKTNALNDVNQSKNKAIKEVEDAGAHYQEQIDDLQKESAAQSVTLENLKGEVELKLNSPYLNNKNETHITNSDNGLVDNLIIEGNTYQETTKGYNLFDKETMGFTICGLRANGEIVTNINTYATTDFFPIEENTAYYIQLSSKFRMSTRVFFDENKDVVSYDSGNATFTSPEGAKYYRAQYALTNITVLSDSDVELIKNSYMLELGNVKHDYEPYTGCKPSPSIDYPQEIKGVDELNFKVVGKNLFDKDDTINGYLSANDIFSSNQNANFKEITSKNYVPIDSSKRYLTLKVKATITNNTNWAFIGFYDENHNYITCASLYDGNNKKNGVIEETMKINIPTNAKYFKASYRQYNDGVLQIEYGQTATDYQSYTSQSFNYTLSNPLYRLSDSVYDYIDVDKGKIVRNVAKKTLDGSENNWISLTNKENTKIFSSRLYDIKADSKLLCENLQYANDDSEKITCSNTDVYIGILKSRLEDTTVDEFKKFLSIHPIIIYYALAESIEENIPVDLLEQLEKIKSYYPQTNIMFDTEVEPYINFDYKLNLKSWIEDKDNEAIIYDKKNKEKDKYSSTFFENMFALQRTGEIYTVKFPKWETSHISTGEKLDANAGLICEPSTKTIKGQNDYVNIPLFKTYDVNAYVDDEGVRHVTAIKGDKDFKDEGKVDVFVLGMSYYEKVWEDDQYWYYSRTDSPRDGYTVARECINRDGSIQPFALYAKYVSGFIDKVPYSSKGLIPGRVYSSTPLPSEDSFSANNSYNNMITNYHKKGNFYCGGMTCDYKYILSTFYLKYATLNTQSIMYGCANCNFQYKAAIQSEDKNTYFPVTKSQATQIEIGSSVSVGYQSKFSSTITVDRAYSNTHRYADDVKVLKKEDIDDNNVAIYLNITEPFNTMPVTIADGVESEIYISSMHWQSGFSDDVLDRDGCPCETKAQLVNGKFPMVIQGIEIMVGGYETYANAFMDIVDSTGKREVYVQNDASQLTTNVTTAKASYKKSQYAIQPSKVNSWNYITRIDFDLENGAFIQTKCGQTSSGTGVGFADGVYVDASSTGQRECLALGYLWYGGGAGLSCLNAYYGLGSAYWSILSRLSINGVGGELTTG